MLLQYLAQDKLDQFVKSKDEMFWFLTYHQGMSQIGFTEAPDLALQVATTYLESGAVTGLLFKYSYSQAAIDKAIASLIDVTKELRAHWECPAEDQPTYNEILKVLFSYRQKYSWGVLQDRNATDEIAYLKKQYPMAGEPTQFGYYLYRARPYSYQAVATAIIACAAIYCCFFGTSQEHSADDQEQENALNQEN